MSPKEEAHARPAPELRADAWTAVFPHPLFQIQAKLAVLPNATFPVARMSTADWVNVVAITDDQDLVLVRQHRYGIEAQTLEVAGGMVDPGESPQVAAERELVEETGYGGGVWTSLGAVHPNPAIQDNQCWLFLARGVRKLGAPQPEDTEDIAVELRPWSEAADLIQCGEITHALAIVGIQKVLLSGGSAPRI